MGSSVNVTHDAGRDFFVVVRGHVPRGALPRFPIPDSILDETTRRMFRGSAHDLQTDACATVFGIGEVAVILEVVRLFFEPAAFHPEGQL